MSDRPSQLRVLALVMLPVAVFLERGVYYQFRSTFFLRAMDSGASLAEISKLMTTVGVWTGILGYVLGGLLSLVRGHLAALVGLALSLLGYLLMAVAPSGWAAAEVLTRLGSGCAMLGFFAALAGVGSNLGQRVAGVALILAAVNVGAFLGPLGATAAKVSPWLAYVGLVPMLLALVLLAVDWTFAASWERKHRPAESAIDWVHALGVTGLVILAGLSCGPIDHFSSVSLFDSLRGSSGPVLVLAGLVPVVGPVLASVALGLAGLLAPRSVQPAPVTGAGLLCAGLGGGLGVAGSALGLGLLLWVSSFFGGLGTALVSALLLALLLGAFSRRWVGLGLFTYFAATQGVGGIFYVVGTLSPEAGLVVGGLSAGVALLLGAVALISSKPLSAWLVKEPETQPEAESAAAERD